MSWVSAVVLEACRSVGSRWVGSGGDRIPVRGLKGEVEKIVWPRRGLLKVIKALHESCGCWKFCFA